MALLLGAKYHPVAALMAILGWAAAGIFASSGPVIWLTITNRQYRIVLALLVVDLLGLGLNLLLAGVLKWGVEGIAGARVVTSWSLCLLYVLFGLGKYRIKQDNLKKPG